MTIRREALGSAKSRVVWIACALWTAMSLQAVRAAEGDYDEALSVTVGQTLLMKIPRANRVAAGNADTVDVKVFEDTEEVLIIGKREGVTDLRVWTRDGDRRSYVLRVQGIAVPPPPVKSMELETTILIRAKLLEVKKSALKNIGVDWADLAEGPIFGTVQELKTNPFFRVIPEIPGVDNFNLPPFDVGTGNNYLALTSVVDSVINLLVQNGDARLLAEPTLTCINGGKADFLAGGEVPIPLVDNDGRVHVEFKQFGIILNIEPRANDTGLIRTKVGVEVSSIDRAISVLGIPGFATRKTNTEMNVQSMQTMVVAGLYSSDDAKNVQKFPLLAEVPLLGELFKSREFKRGNTELVVLVTPQVISAESQPVRDAVQKFDDLMKESEERLKFKLKD